MKHAKKLICFGVAIATILTASACNFIGTNSSSSSSQNPTPIDYIAKDKPLVEKAMADGELSVLTIGNSFSVDAMEYAYEIADDLGIEVRFGNLYKPGCSIRQHYDYAKANSQSYTYYECVEGQWSSTKNYRTLDAVQSYNWDYIVMQHDPDQSGWQTTYSTLPDLISIVKPLCPNATLVWHMTWAYQSDSQQTAFKQYNNDQMEMYNQIIAATKAQILTNADISMVIPSGSVIQNARTSSLGDTLTRDGYHMSLDVGRYIVGVAYIAKLSGVNIQNLQYKPEGVTETARKIAIDSVEKALKNPFEITKVNM